MESIIQLTSGDSWLEACDYLLRLVIRDTDQHKRGEKVVKVT